MGRVEGEFSGLVLAGLRGAATYRRLGASLKLLAVWWGPGIQRQHPASVALWLPSSRPALLQPVAMAMQRGAVQTQSKLKWGLNEWNK